MQARAFRFDAFRTTPRKPRSPLLRVLFGLLGLAVLALLVFFGLFVGAAMLVAGLAWRLLQGRKGTAQAGVADGHIVDAEYRVVERQRLPTPH